MADEVNITPEMIENLMNMLKNNNPNNANNSNNNEALSNNSNTSNTYNNSNTSNSSNSSNSSNDSHGSKDSGNNSSFNFDGLNFGNNIDFDTIMKLKSIMDTFNSNDNRDSKLLYSLKPYLRKSRQDKLDQYINLVKFSQVAKFFNKN